MKKVAVLIPEFFWSSIPYENLTVYKYLKNKLPNFQIDLLIFRDDIRINKVFKDVEKYYFDKNLFKSCNPIEMRDWKHLSETTRKYDLLISSVHLFPKTRQPAIFFPEFDNVRSVFKCPLMTLDIGGSDIFRSECSTYLCVKGPVWKTWLANDGFKKENIFVTGSPQYDYYHHSHLLEPKECKVLKKDQFLAKYKLKENDILMIAPSNPASHQDQFKENVAKLRELYRLCDAKKYQIIIKTYPNDYLFYDTSRPYSGIYHRVFKKQPHYRYLKKIIPTAEVIESQDHFAAMKYSRKLFNMSGSHLAWETYFTDCESFSMNYKNQKYYCGAPYLPPEVKLPDDKVNIEIESLEEIFSNKKNTKDCSQFICKEFAHENIKKVVEEILK